MGAIAAILVAGGIVAFIVGAYLKLVKGGRLAKTPHVPTGTAACNAQAGNDKSHVSVEGQVECPQQLLSPVTQTPCLYYSLKVTGSWKQGDATKSKTYIEEKTAATFSLNDGSGSVAIDASGGGDLETKQTFKETKKEGFFADLKGAIGKGEPMMFGQYAFHNPVNSKANKFECVERLMPLPEKAFALGKLENGRIGSTGMFGMMMSSKTREELMGSTAKNTKMAFIGGAAASGVGLLVGVISAFV